MATEGGRVFLGRAITLSRGYLRDMLLDEDAGADVVLLVAAVEEMGLVTVVVPVFRAMTSLLSSLLLVDVAGCRGQYLVRQNTITVNSAEWK